MKTVKDLLDALDNVGIPFTQIAWQPNKAPTLPYAVVIPHMTSNVFKDDVVLAVPVRYTVELYTRERDVPLEMRVQEALNNAHIAWERDHTVDTDGYVVIAIYSMTLTE